MIQTLLNLFKQTPNWKKPIELFYSKYNILTVTTLDHNSKDYYHAINDPVEYEWYNHPSRTPIKDNELTKRLNKYYSQVLRGKRARGGWVRSL